MIRQLNNRFNFTIWLMLREFSNTIENLQEVEIAHIFRLSTGLEWMLAQTGR